MAGGAHFTVAETDSDLRVALRSTDGDVEVDVHVAVEPELSGSALFSDVTTASRFFEQGAVGWSPGRSADDVEGVRLDTTAWRVEPGRIVSVRSSYFSDASVFPPGSAEPDCALVMRRVPVRWTALSSLAAG